MGKVLKAVGSIVGLSGAPKAQAPEVSVRQPVADVEEGDRTAKASRASLFSTPGGVAGQELTPEQVKRRQTLLGN